MFLKGSDKDQPLYDLEFAADRIAAAVQAARSLSFPFTLTAQAENFVRGKPDLGDTIQRLQAYERAGADVLFAPALPDLAAVQAVCSAVSRPVNFMAGIRGKSFSVAELAAALRVHKRTPIHLSSTPVPWAPGRRIRRAFYTMRRLVPQPPRRNKGAAEGCS